MLISPLLQQLMQALRCLPGVGPKSSQRMALHLLQRDREQAQQLVTSLSKALAELRHCQHCHMLSEAPLCPLCQSPRRQEDILCIVTTPADLMAIEQTSSFKGRYFILNGHLSPLDGIGPRDIGIPQCLTRIKGGEFKEIILATHPTVEGEATAHFLMDALAPFQLKLTRLAQGVPMGSELEYLDGNTLSQALNARSSIT